MTRTLGWLLGIENVASIERLEVSLAAPWAREGAFWLFLIVVACAAAVLFFYVRLQSKGSRRARWLLAACRAAVVAMLVVMLADPIAQLGLVTQQRPLMYVIFDGTESMAIEDDYPAPERNAIQRAVAGRRVAQTNRSASNRQSRTALVQSLVRDGELLKRLESKQLDLEALLFDGNTTSQLHKLSLGSGRGRIDGTAIARQLSTKGQVTALGEVLQELSQQHRSARLAGVILVSDFAQNSGASPLAGEKHSPAAALGVPLYTVGVGATEALDLAVDLQADLKMKKGERANLVVQLRQSGLDGQPATIRLAAQKLGGQSGAASGELVIGQRTVTLNRPAQTLEFSFTPADSGRFQFVASAARLEGEVAEQNNQATRQINVIDDFLRLLYVAYEPNWEWRFVKEVFHRDKLIGMEGFRTFLSSSDPRVRESNVLFLPTLTPKRSEFFATDVLVIDDVPRSMLSDRFFELTKEYVGTLGGGLVVIAGPRFGPRELYQTPLADMLPVIVDPSLELRSAPEHDEFRPRLTPHAERYAFMQLGADSDENRRAWDNLGKLPWYQPVAAVHPQAEVLAEHPTDLCADGKTPQPLIAIRKYGKGEVAYLGMNEMWRLRRRFGEKYYREFWSQLIYRLGMSHALGPEKRFVVSLDQQQYAPEQKVALSVEAYDENYEPLKDEALPEGGLTAEMIVPGSNGGQTQTLLVPMLRPGVFETRVPVFAAGQYSIRVKDPITGKFDERRFEVTPLSAERRRAVRDEKLQQELATATGGRAYDLTTVQRLPDDLKVEPILERSVRSHSLWATPLWFGIVVGLLIVEWAARKGIGLA